MSNLCQKLTCRMNNFKPLLINCRSILDKLMRCNQLWHWERHHVNLNFNKGFVKISSKLEFKEFSSSLQTIETRKTHKVELMWIENYRNWRRRRRRWGWEKIIKSLNNFSTTVWARRNYNESVLFVGFQAPFTGIVHRELCFLLCGIVHNENRRKKEKTTSWIPNTYAIDWLCFFVTLLL